MKNQENLCGIYREKISEKKKKQKRSNGYVTVARGMGGEGSVANGHMTVGRWGKGGRGRGSLAGAGPQGGKGRKGGGEEEREGGWGVGPAREERGGGGPDRPATLGPSGPPTLGLSGPSLWANQARHPWARPARHLGPSGPPSIKPLGWPRALKKIKIRPGPARPVDCQQPYRPGPNRAAGLT